MMKKTVLFLAVAVCGASAHANVVGTDIQTFNTTTNGIDFVTVQSSETLEPGIVNVGFFLNYAVNTMPNYENVGTQGRTDFEDTTLGGDINVGVGLKRNWDVGFSFPQIYAQDTDNNNNVYSGYVSETGFTEYRLNTKYRFYGDQDGGLAFIGSVNFDQVANNPFAGSNAGPTYNFELAWDSTIQRYAYGFNIGYRMRDPGTQLPGIPIEPYGDQLIASAAVSYLLTSVDTKLIGEVYSSFPLDSLDRTSDREVSTMELLLGMKKDIRHDIALHFGGGTEVYHGSSSPDWRVYTGVNWNFGPLWYGEAKAGEPRRLEADNVEYFASKPLTPSEKFVAGDVLFAFNSSELSPAFEKILLQLAAYLNMPPGFKSLVVEGHTDSVGAEEYNRQLSQRRADSVRNFLVTKGGLPEAKVNGIGYGESQPVADNANFQGRAKNRRVEFNIVR
jgi:outer membrane protein OmpA-like peptidoglycan-associated protein